MFSFLGKLFLNSPLPIPEEFIINCFQAEFFKAAAKSGENADICHYGKLPGIKRKKIKEAGLL